MSKEKNYKLDEEKFLLSLNNGDNYITSYSSIEKTNSKGKTFYKQAYSYTFDDEFIEKNKNKLIEKGILIFK
ncbi:hypothetical protein [uncultured Fusobacterium sp.]|uniref:hypothetical protein n=1 Tax=uncultured Fusobacterium sp. TaxID=159267 RepID=UPI0015A5B9B8|nr:hypothetical protein [uncultured Fusobacterium sp.]